MISCPRCNEAIGENIDVCPFCKTVITEETKMQAISKNERIHEQAVANATKEYGKRVRNEIAVGIVMVLLAIIGMIVIATLDLSAVFGLILFAFILTIYVLSILKLRIGLCPYCESLMGRGMLFRTHCPRCGGRLR